MPRQEPRWISRLVVDAIQTDMLLTHGGMPGLRDENALESALPGRGSVSHTIRRRTWRRSPRPTGMGSSATIPTTMGTSVLHSWSWQCSWV